MPRIESSNRCGWTSNGGYVRYDPEYCLMLYEALINGYTVMDFCMAIGCSRSTFYQWVKTCKNLKNAFYYGLQGGKRIWTRRCITPMGKLPNTSFHRLLATNELSEFIAAI
ncbi:MAG: helix-turn-helix domain-containing protein [Promethearchaeota archaeon]